MSEPRAVVDAGESLFSRARRGVLPDELLLSEVAELIAADGPRVDPARLSDAIARLAAYRDAGLLAVRAVKRGVVVMPLAGKIRAPNLHGSDSRRRSLDAHYEFLRYGPGPSGQHKPIAPKAVQQFETDYYVSREAVQIIVHLESRYGPLGRGFIAWADITEEAYMGRSAIQAELGDLLNEAGDVIQWTPAWANIRKWMKHAGRGIGTGNDQMLLSVVRDAIAALRWSPRKPTPSRLSSVMTNFGRKVGG